MSTSVSSGDGEINELRHRESQPQVSPQTSKDGAAIRHDHQDLDEDDKKLSKDDQKKRTYGRTADGTIFTVPVTHDMVSQLLSPTQPKNISDIFIVGSLIAQILTLFLLPSGFKAPVFAILFTFWRACYNAGIGWLLHQQSNYNTLVEWAKKTKVFEDPKTGRNPRPWLYKLLKREMETKIPNDYDFQSAPIEYNTWLTFRRVVDLILMNDFISYCLFAIACAGRPADEGAMMTFVRWMAGMGLFMFNVWVKLDAHRVVKDFAWYWGDFFYLIDQDLTFDGVYEIAPHPMYSVGYAGFYGISLMAASYRVLAISIAAHAAQFAFLLYIENPHIEKTYNPPAPRHRASDANLVSLPEAGTARSELSPVALANALTAEQRPATIKKLLGLQSFDLHRMIDVACIIIYGQLLLLAICTPPTVFYQALFVVNAVFWRVWYSFGIGWILNQQTRSKKWTRHFIKYGEDSDEAWRQWKGLYHISMTMCWGSFGVAACKLYHLPDDWNYGMATLRHVVGFALIALQMWTSFSIYESLGEFGWFFGDFFFDQKQKLTYSGIYRFLNNPERFLGIAAVWGVALITWSRPIFFLALLSHVSTLMFIQFVERPHMEKRYGQKLRDESGLSKSLKRSLPKPLQKWQGSVDRVVDETVDFMEDFVMQAQAKLTSGMDNFVKDYTNVFRQFPARITITRLASSPQINNPAEYSLVVDGKKALAGDQRIPDSRKTDFHPPAFLYGAPIRVKWQAPANHSKRDWIGLYCVGHNDSKDVTRTSSLGRWIATSRGEHIGRGEYGILVADVPSERKEGSVIGEVEFSGEKLWWSTGIFEFRYHHDGKHNVMAVSEPFEICVPTFDEDDVEVDMSAGGSIQHAVEAALLPLVQDCFDRDSEIAPSTVDEPFGGLVERDGKYAKRVVYAVKLMFGIEFSPEVVKVDGSVARLAWRICNAKQVLAPYSMTSSPGRDTPSSKY